MMPKDTFLIERMIRVETKAHVCRIWRDPDKGELSDSEIATRASTYLKDGVCGGGILSGPESVAPLLAQIDGVNSVEIINRTGNGICVHKNWP